MNRPLRWADFAEMSILFWIQWAALGIWNVPLSPILDAHGLGALRPFAFATSGVAALFSPLIFGAMADRHTPPVIVLRCLACGCAAGMAAVAWSIQHAWPPLVIFGLIQLMMLCTVPVTSISVSIVMARLNSPKTQFGPIRSMGTLGWMCGCWLVSAMNADSSLVAHYSGALIWLVLAGFTFTLPAVPPPASTGKIGLRERMGWDALVLLKNPDHRVVFITAALFSIPLAAFYPYTPLHLRDLGLSHTSAWMTLGQVSEMILMFALAGVLARVRLKWVFAAGLAFGILRFALCMANGPGWVLLGISMHGFSYALFFITAQIYLEQRIDPAWRTRAQALMSLMTSGVGNLLGYLGVGGWYAVCMTPTGARWQLFWGVLSAACLAIFVVFACVYHGRGTGLLQRAGVKSEE